MKIRFRPMRVKSSSLEKTPIKDGQFLIVEDRNELYLDKSDEERIRLTDIIETTEYKIQNFSFLENRFYFATDSKILYYYNDGEWIVLSNINYNINDITSSINRAIIKSEYIELFSNFFLERYYFTKENNVYYIELKDFTESKFAFVNDNNYSISVCFYADDDTLGLKEEFDNSFMIMETNEYKHIRIEIECEDNSKLSDYTKVFGITNKEDYMNELKEEIKNTIMDELQEVVSDDSISTSEF